MNDLENDQPVDDLALFDQVTTGEASEQATEVPVETKTVAEPAAVTTTPAEPTTTVDPKAEPAIPPSRLREEADARRTAERERDELRARLAAYEKPSPTAAPSKEQPKPKPWWENPEEATQRLVSEALTPLQTELIETRLHYSKRAAVGEFGEETVSGAYAAMQEAVSAGQLDRSRVNVMLAQSRDPVGDIVRWHKQRSTLKEIGGDVTAYRTRILDEAMKDPEFQKRVIEQARTAAQPATELPGRSNVTSIPSLRNVGTTASPTGGENDPSDADLFASTTRRRKG